LRLLPPPGKALRPPHRHTVCRNCGVEPYAAAPRHPLTAAAPSGRPFATQSAYG